MSYSLSHTGNQYVQCLKKNCNFYFIVNYIQNTIENNKKDIYTSKFHIKKRAHTPTHRVIIVQSLYISNIKDNFYMNI